LPLRLCSHRGCPAPASYRGRCGDHARQVARDTHPNRAIYNSKRWQILRRSVLFENPLCRCGQIATDVHHRHDISQGGDPWDRAALEALCKSCHSQITRGRQHDQGAG
jgi:5-methylcytosine-specific restriction endonuclease McrA